MGVRGSRGCSPPCPAASGQAPHPSPWPGGRTCPAGSSPICFSCPWWRWVSPSAGPGPAVSRPWGKQTVGVNSGPRGGTSPVSPHNPPRQTPASPQRSPAAQPAPANGPPKAYPRPAAPSRRMAAPQPPPARSPFGPDTPVALFPRPGRSRHRCPRHTHRHDHDPDPDPDRDPDTAACPNGFPACLARATRLPLPLALAAILGVARPHRCGQVGCCQRKKGER